MGIFPKVRGEDKKIFQLPPSFFVVWRGGTGIVCRLMKWTEQMDYIISNAWKISIESATYRIKKTYFKYLDIKIFSDSRTPAPI